MNTTGPAPHVALVDDDADVRVALHALLRSYGYRVSLHDGAAGLLAAGLAGVDCVVSDVQMPDMDGLALQSRLAALPAAPPCILMTAFPDAHVRERALRAGAAGFFDKPVDADGLVKCIQKACGNT